MPGLQPGAKNFRDEKFKRSQSRMCESLMSALWVHTDMVTYGTWTLPKMGLGWDEVMKDITEDTSPSRLDMP